MDPTAAPNNTAAAAEVVDNTLVGEYKQDVAERTQEQAVHNRDPLLRNLTRLRLLQVRSI